MHRACFEHWQLCADGPPLHTPRARLWPVRTASGAAAMLKIATVAEEGNAAPLLAWWNGDGAARLLAQQGAAILIERADGPSLRQRATDGEDDACTAQLCQVLERLHRPRGPAPSALVPLHAWFADLLHPGSTLPPWLEQCGSLATRLLAAERPVIPLHGDLHHDNVLAFEGRGWLAIDPKGLLGERAFDYTPLFLNPDLCGPGIHVAARPERFRARLHKVCMRAQLAPDHLLRWIAASAGLSAAWLYAEGRATDVNQAVAGMALAALDGA